MKAHIRHLLGSPVQVGNVQYTFSGIKQAGHYKGTVLHRTSDTHVTQWVHCSVLREGGPPGGPRLLCASVQCCGTIAVKKCDICAILVCVSVLCAYSVAMLEVWQ